MSKKSTRKRPARKVGSDWPPKPYPDFPLTPHVSGAWQKKIKGKVRYFGRWGRVRGGKMERLPGDGVKEALELYEEQREDLYAGRTPRVKGEGLRIRDLCNRFLNAKKRKLDAGELTAGTLREYRLTTDRLVTAFDRDRLVDDLASDDFDSLRAELADAFGPVRLGNEIQKVRTVFKYAYDAGLIDRPVRYGPDFKKPSASVLRKHKAASGEKMYEAAEIHQLLAVAPPAWRAMILLGVNCGLGNTDCGSLEDRHLDLDKDWLDFPRPKTGVARRCPLWAETIAALREAIAARPTPRSEENAALVFLNSYGAPWCRDGEVDSKNRASAPVNSVARGFRKVLDDAGLYRKGLGFYTLRHVFRTVADGSGDQVAANQIMGHVDPSMAATYRERIDDSRLVAVVDYVHDWLFADAPEDDPARKEPEICDPIDPSDPPRLCDHSDPGSHGAEGSQDARKVLQERPRLRIVG